MRHRWISGLLGALSTASAFPAHAAATDANDVRAVTADAGASTSPRTSPVGSTDAEPSFQNAPLDTRRQRKEYALQVSKIRSRASVGSDGSSDGSDGWHGGADIVLSSGLAPRVPWLRVSGYRGGIFRIFDSKSFSVTPFFQGLEGGVQFGFVEVGATIGVSVLSVDVAHANWSVGLFQPRTSALAGLKFHDLHVRAVAFSEFYWRWFGGDSAVVQGLGIQLVIGGPNT